MSPYEQRRLPNDQEATVRLNVGGAYTGDFQRSTLLRISDPFASTLSIILVVVWGGKLPRDAGGRLVMNVSPEYVQEIVSVLSWGFRRIAGCKRFCGNASVAEGRNLPSLETMSIMTGSTVLEQGEFAFGFTCLRVDVFGSLVR